MRSFGLQASAIAIITRWRMPPESWCGRGFTSELVRADAARAQGLELVRADARGLEDIDPAFAAMLPPVWTAFCPSLECAPSAGQADC